MVSCGMWQTWINATIPRLTGSRILEIGYGPGHLQMGLNQMGKNVFGIDESPQMARLAHSRLRKHMLPNRLGRGTAQALPFAAASFDQIVMTFPAEFVYHPETFAEMQRVLTRDGSAILLPFAWITGHSLCERMAAWLNHITGEAPEHPDVFLSQLRIPGFTMRSEMVKLRSSQLLFLILRNNSSGE